MNRNFFILLILFWAIPSGFAQLKTYSFEEAERLSAENPKPIFVFIHTSWCKYCNMMENSAFKNQEVIRLLNADFYFVSLDAETKTTIAFNNHSFNYQPTGVNSGIHELANELAAIDSIIVYPTISILDFDATVLFQKPSYQNAASLVSVLEKIKSRY